MPEPRDTNKYKPQKNLKEYKAVIAEQPPISKTAGDLTRPGTHRPSPLKTAQTAAQMQQEALQPIQIKLEQIKKDIHAHEEALSGALNQSFFDIMRYHVRPLIDLNIKKTDATIELAHLKHRIGKANYEDVQQAFENEFTELERTRREMDELARSPESDTPEGDKALRLFKEERAARVQICKKLGETLESPANGCVIDHVTRVKIDLVHQMAEPIYQMPDTVYHNEFFTRGYANLPNEPHYGNTDLPQAKSTGDGVAPNYGNPPVIYQNTHALPPHQKDTNGQNSKGDREYGNIDEINPWLTNKFLPPNTDQGQGPKH